MNEQEMLKIMSDVINSDPELFEIINDSNKINAFITKNLEEIKFKNEHDIPIIIEKDKFDKFKKAVNDLKNIENKIRKMIDERETDPLFEYMDEAILDTIKSYDNIIDNIIPNIAHIV